MRTLLLVAAGLLTFGPGCSEDATDSPAVAAGEETASASRSEPMTPEEAYGRPREKPVDPHAGHDHAAGAHDEPEAELSAFPTPEGWKQQPPANAMRVAQYVLPKAEGDAVDADVVITRFPGDGGGVDANVDRWEGQFAAEGRKVAARETVTVGDREVTFVDVSGRFRGGMPGAGVTADQAGWRMLGAVVTDPEGYYFVKALGPERTVARWRDSFVAFVKSAFAEL